MFPQSYLVVIGKRSILHRWLFDLSNTLAHEHFLQFYQADDCEEWQRNLNIHRHYQLRTAIMCLSHGTFLAEWVNTLLTLQKRVGTRMLIYVDDVELLTSTSIQLLQRIIPQNHMVYTHNCQRGIRKLLLTLIKGEMEHIKSLQFTDRELAILSGFVQGKDAEWQAKHFGIATCTVFQHQKNCANKLGLRTLRDLARMKLGK